MEAYDKEIEFALINKIDPKEHINTLINKKQDQIISDGVDAGKSNLEVYEEAMDANNFVLQGVCKDCGNGTLNNELIPAFEIEPDVYGDYSEVVCKRCGSHHVDVVVL